MIAFLQGRLVEAGSNRIIVDVGGVGYEVFISSQCHGRLPRIGEVIRVLIHQHVREDMLALYGFLSEQERDLFKLLLSVSGVGPKVAITILSGIAVEDFYLAVRGEDLGRLSSISGVGKKTAERLVLELKEKAALFLSLQPRGPRMPGTDLKQNDATRALIALGYKPNQAQQAVERAVKGKDGGKKFRVEDLVREALKVVGAT